MTTIHPTADVGPEVQLGTRVHVDAYAVVRGSVEVDDDVWIGPHAVIGTAAQMRDGPLDPAAGAGVRIGRSTVVREFVTIHQGIETATVVGPDCYLMAYAHVPHDAHIGASCTLSNAVQMGGHTWVGPGANLGLGATVHQRSVIGAGAMVGMQSVVTRPVPPFTTVVGAPARPVGVNRIGLLRAAPSVEPTEELLAALAPGADSLDALPDELRAHVDDFRAAVAHMGTG